MWNGSVVWLVFWKSKERCIFVPKPSWSTTIKFDDIFFFTSVFFEFLESFLISHLLSKKTHKSMTGISCIYIFWAQIVSPDSTFWSVWDIKIKADESKCTSFFAKVFPWIGKCFDMPVYDSENFLLTSSVISSYAFDFAVGFESKRECRWVGISIKKLSIDDGSRISLGQFEKSFHILSFKFRFPFIDVFVPTDWFRQKWFDMSFSDKFDLLDKNFSFTSLIDFDIPIFFDLGIRKNSRKIFLFFFFYFWFFYFWNLWWLLFCLLLFDDILLHHSLERRHFKSNCRWSIESTGTKYACQCRVFNEFFHKKENKE